MNNIRRLPERTTAELHAPSEWSKVTDTVPHLATPPALVYPPTTRTVLDKGRVSLAVNAVPVSQVLGWPVGPLQTRRDGQWIVLAPDESGVATRHNDGRASCDHLGRLRLPRAVLSHLGVDVGGEVALVVLPEKSALAIGNPR